MTTDEGQSDRGPVKAAALENASNPAARGSSRSCHQVCPVAFRGFVEVKGVKKNPSARLVVEGDRGQWHIARGSNT